MWKSVLLLLGVIWTPGPVEAATPACPTAGGKTCVFPFVTSAGESVSECQAYKGKSYCATSLKSTGKYATWDYCVDIKCPVIGKSDMNESCPTVQGKSCIFPFKTKGGESVSVCQPYNNQYFCATSLKSDGRYSGWDYCDATKCPNKGMVQATASCPTVKGKSCIFPFKTKGGESVRVCQPYNNKHFCATSLKSDGSYSGWGYCTSECPKHGEAAGITMGGLVLSPTSCPSVKGDKCIFPFKKGSTTYNVCQPYKNKYYCATSLNSDGSYRTWDYCDTKTCPNPGTCSPGGDGGCNYPFRQGGSFSVCAKTSSHLFWCTAGDNSGSGSGSGSQCPKPTPAKPCPKPEECPVTPKPTAVSKEESCPAAEPDLGSPCSQGQEAVCYYGKECCCGECNHSLEVSCSGGSWRGRATEFCMLPPEIKCPNYTSPAPYTKPPPADSRCPVDQPDFGDACNLPEGIECPYGKECCCGSCHPSLLLSCMARPGSRTGTWGGLNTDACMRPDCGTTMTTTPDNICSRIRCPADACSSDPLGTCCCCSKAAGTEEQLLCGKDSSSPPPGCICPAVYSPVCGTDGKDYGNQCQAGCSGAKPACEGRCPCKETSEKPDCICMEIYQPVCGTDGRDYSNSCKAACHGIKPACEGACPCTTCLCTADYSPVCGKDGKDYSNACQAGCGGGQTEVACEGTCPCEGK